MAKKRQSGPPQTTVYPVRSFPLDLLEKMRRIKTKTYVPVYVQIIDAVREKLERDEAEKES